MEPQNLEYEDQTRKTLSKEMKVRWDYMSETAKERPIKG